MIILKIVKNRYKITISNLITLNFSNLLFAASICQFLLHPITVIFKSDGMLSILMFT